MKTICFLVISLLLLERAGAQSPTGAQPPVKQSPPKDTVILSAGFGALSLNNPGHSFMETIPYTVTPVPVGSPTRQNFTGSLNGPFRSAMYLADLLNVEIVHKNHGIDMGVGMNRDLGNTYGAYLRGGYKYIFTFRGFLLKPGLDLLYLFGHNENMGSIDNAYKMIDMLGFTSKDEFTVGTTDSDGNTTDNTYNTDHLDVDYHRTNLVVEPMIALATKPVWRMSFSLEAGWLIQAFQNSAVRLVQVGDDSNSTTHTLGSVHIKNDGSIGGPYIGVNVGIYLKNKTAG